MFSFSGEFQTLMFTIFLYLLAVLILYIIFVILLPKLVVFVLTPSTEPKTEKFTENRVRFLSKDELYTYLIENKDKYYDSFFEKDFQLRRIQTITDYKENNIRNAVCEYTPQEKERLRLCCSEVDKKLQTMQIGNYFDGKKAFQTISWNLGCIQGNMYENGLPHTRGENLIIITKTTLENKSNDQLQRTLLHELIHLYQKKYPEDVEKYLQTKNIKKYKRIERKDAIRANPDTDDWIYYDGNTNQLFQAIYRKDAHTISNVMYTPINDRKYEHPFEMMAIEIAND